MDQFITTCLNTEAKISSFLKITKCEEMVNLQDVMGYKWNMEEELISSNNSYIKEEIDIDFNEVKPSIERLVTFHHFFYRCKINYCSSGKIYQFKIAVIIH